MKKKHIKTLAFNKLKIATIDFSEKLKGGSLEVCPPTFEYSCSKGSGCITGNMGG
jgi:Fe-S cluster assembly iron-binding protein IscA